MRALRDDSTGTSSRLVTFVGLMKYPEMSYIALSR
eukprot:COSAG06_NODE_43087_length_375_cov_0.931159_2_plen_34_part_01